MTPQKSRFTPGVQRYDRLPLQNSGIVMPEWKETFRAIVPPWECDITEHFTIAYYFDRLAESEANLAEALGLGEMLAGGGFTRTFHVRFARELRAGASYHIDAAPIRIDADELALGHRFVDSFSKEVVTWIEGSWDLAGKPVPEEVRAVIGSRLVTWEGPAKESRPEPETFEGFIPTRRGRVRPIDLDAAGRFGLAAFVHRFSDACIQGGAAFGMTAEWLEENRRGFSTFELILRIIGNLPLDVPYVCETGIVHLGNTSLRFVHRLLNARTGEEVARMGQYGVFLDLDARRPARLPDDVRTRATTLLVPVV
jgi:acyl-CoA thioesterase FadM